MCNHSITWGNISSGLKHLLFSVLCKSVFKARGTTKSGRPLEVSLLQLHVFRSKQCWVWTYFPNRHTDTQCIKMYVYIYAYMSDTDQHRKYSTHGYQQYEQPHPLVLSAWRGWKPVSQKFRYIHIRKESGSPSNWPWTPSLPSLWIPWSPHCLSHKKMHTLVSPLAGPGIGRVVSQGLVEESHAQGCACTLQLGSDGGSLKVPQQSGLGHRTSTETQGSPQHCFSAGETQHWKPWLGFLQ